VKCLKPTSKDSKNNNKKRKLMRKKNTVWRKGKTKAKTNQTTILKKQKKQNQQQKKATWIYIYMRLFFSSVCFAFFSVSFSVFFFRRWPDDADLRKCKTLEEKNKQKKAKKTAAYKCILGLLFFAFGFAFFCFLFRFWAVLIVFLFCLKKLVCITLCFLLIYSSFYVFIIL